jgi:diguanylate cyclase (GGDEF)-like protein/PAS domain S-box-containing protein
MLDAVHWHVPSGSAAFHDDLFRLAVAGSGLSVWDWDVSRQAVTLYEPDDTQDKGMRPTVASAGQWVERIHPDDAPGFHRMLGAHLRGETPCLRCEHRFLLRGEFRWVLSRGRTVDVGPSGTPTRLVGTLSDITERKRSESIFDDIFEANTAVKLIVHPASGRIMAANRAAQAFYGYAREEILALHIWDINTMDRRELAERMDKASRTMQTYFEFRHRISGGELRDVEVYSAPLEYMGSTCLLSIIHDVTEKCIIRRQLEYLAATDELTDCMNRRAFLAELEAQIGQSFRSGLPLALAMFDLDHFKSINDVYGHHAGDATLKGFVSLCREGVRVYDRIGRLGGEEFGLILPQTGLADATGVVERIVAACSRRTIQIGSIPVQVTVSAGLTRLLPGDDTHAIITRADKAMYSAKENGRDRFEIA